MPVAAGFLFLTFLPTSDAQEIPRPSSARQKAQTSIPSLSAGDYKVGQVQFRFGAGLNSEFVDNINQQSGAKTSDATVTASVSMDAIWPVTKLNTLQFHVSVGYPFHLNNSSLDRVNVTVSPDSALSFDVYSGDFRINFHDSFSIQNDLINTGTNGVAQLPRFTNTIGINVLWDLNEVILTLGYDHLNFTTLGSATSTTGTVASNTSDLDHSTDQISASGTYKLSSVALLGLESTWSYSSYPNRSGSDFDAFSVGPFIEYQLTQYTHLYVGGGFRSFSSSNAGTVSLTTTTPPSSSGGSGTSVRKIPLWLTNRRVRRALMAHDSRSRSRPSRSSRSRCWVSLPGMV